MTIDKNKCLSLEEDKGVSVAFGNNAPTRIMGKGTIILDNGKTKP